MIQVYKLNIFADTAFCGFYFLEKQNWYHENNVINQMSINIICYTICVPTIKYNFESINMLLQNNDHTSVYT